MRVTLRRLAALGLVGALGFAAAPVKKIQFTDTKLKNGLRVIISEDHSAPVFAVAVNYNVGSRDERKGRTGFAHLFEHMMFKGSANVGDGEHPHLVFSNGGSMNGTTNKERTLYYEILPANQLDLALFLEADRMRSLDITEANLDNQRNAVQEERRLARRQPAVRPDIRSARRAGVRQLRLRALGHRLDGRSRAPPRSTTCPRSSRCTTPRTTPCSQHRRRRRHEGRRSRKSASTSSRFHRSRRRRLSTSPSRRRKKSGVRRIEDALARLTRLDMVYKTPPSSSPGLRSRCRVLGTVLSSGRSSRFYENIVRQKQLATERLARSAARVAAPASSPSSGPSNPGKTVADAGSRDRGRD